MLGEREALLLKIFYLHYLMISVIFEHTVGLSLEGDDRPSYGKLSIKEYHHYHQMLCVGSDTFLLRLPP